MKPEKSPENNLISLYLALSQLDTPEAFEKLLHDLCTPQEIKSLLERWRVCQLLEQGDLSYRAIHRITGASLTTIGRVARSLNDPQHQGYRILLDKIKQK